MSVAQWEREAIGERTRDAMRYLKAQGRSTGQVPLGCALAADGATLAPDPAEQATLALVRELRGRGLPIRRIAAELDARGVPAKGGGRWHTATVQRALRAPAA
jgi:DNA invertase Pin-like site-specific DNA recombinase